MSTSSTPYDQAARKIRFLMESHHLTTHRLAEVLDVRKDTIQSVLDGSSPATPSLVQKIAAHFNVPVDFLKTDQPTREGERVGLSGVATPSPTERLEIKPKIKAERRPPTGSLTPRKVAICHQALLELLIEKGVITADEYRSRMQEVENRSPVAE